MTTMMPAAPTADLKHLFATRSSARSSAPSPGTCARTWPKIGWPRASAWRSSSTSTARPRGGPCPMRCSSGRAIRAIDVGRRLAGAHGARPKQDVYDERSFAAGHVELLRLDGLLDDGGEEQALFGWAQPDMPNPARMLASAVDLERWLTGLGPEDRMMLALRQAGHTLGGIAAAMGKSTSAVFAKLRQLGSSSRTWPESRSRPGGRHEPGHRPGGARGDQRWARAAQRGEVRRAKEDRGHRAHGPSAAGAVFIGVALSAVEVTRMLAEAAMVLPNVTGPLVGRRQRGTLRRR